MVGKEIELMRTGNSFWNAFIGSRGVMGQDDFFLIWNKIACLYTNEMTQKRGNNWWFKKSRENSGSKGGGGI